MIGRIKCACCGKLVDVEGGDECERCGDFACFSCLYADIPDDLCETCMKKSGGILERAEKHDRERVQRGSSN